jgi:hypothetical protein
MISGIVIGMEIARPARGFDDGSAKDSNISGSPEAGRRPTQWSAVLRGRDAAATGEIRDVPVDVLGID